MKNIKTNNIYQLMEEMVLKAIKIIQTEAADFSQKNKTHYSGTDDDLVTSADIKAQAMYVDEITKYFPNEGLIGEENGLNIQPKAGHGYFTVDPLDGTKAFGRKQSMGCATMIAHVNHNGVVDAVCIGDINTGEIYGFGPQQKPKRIRFGVNSDLDHDTTSPLEKKYILLKEKVEIFPPEIQRTFNQFKDLEIMSGSIGLLVARLWKSEIGVMVFKSTSYDTPWDNTPLIGMNKALGIIHLEYDPINKELKKVEPKPPKQVTKRENMELLVHQDYADMLIQMITENQ